MMRGRGRAAVIALFFLSSVLVFSQDEEELPFPFVSLLKAEPAGFQIKLSWRDAPETVTKYLVYRYTEELTAENLAMAQTIGQVAPGVQFFIDTPPDEKAYFYAVLAQDSGGRILDSPAAGLLDQLPATAQTQQALPSVRGEVPPMQEPQLKPANELFPNSQRPNPFTPTFQQQFMYTAVHVPH